MLPGTRGRLGQDPLLIMPSIFPGIRVISNESVLRIYEVVKVLEFQLHLSNHLILCNPLLLLPSIFASIRIFSN